MARGTSTRKCRNEALSNSPILLPAANASAISQERHGPKEHINQSSTEIYAAAKQGGGGEERRGRRNECKNEYTVYGSACDQSCTGVAPSKLA